MKKFIAIVLVCMFVCTYTCIASENKPLKNLGAGLDNMVYGSVETPDNINKTNSKGTPVDACTAKTKDDVGRGIARFVKGLWQVATFWYPEDK